MPIHRSHPNHELSCLTPYTSLYKCDGCQMRGHGQRYRCTHQSCDYDLHKECMHPDETLTIEAFPGCTLKFLDRPPPTHTSTWCDICGMNIKGFLYHCNEHGIDLHPQCAMLKRKILVDEVVFELHNGVLAECNHCESKELKGGLKKVPGFSYVSQCKEYSFHVYCLMETQLKHGALLSTSMYSNSVINNNAGMGREVVPIPDRRLQMKVRKRRSIIKFLKVAKLSFKIIWAILTGDPIAIATLIQDVAGLFD